MLYEVITSSLMAVAILRIKSLSHVDAIAIACGKTVARPHKKDNSEYSKVVNEINNTVKEAKSVDRNKLFDDTINGLVSFNMQHPLYSDNEFKTVITSYSIHYTKLYEGAESYG